jgi:hypothetical protein
VGKRIALWGKKLAAKPRNLTLINLPTYTPTLRARNSTGGSSASRTGYGAATLNAAGDVNARYGQDPGLGFYTHVSD